MKPPFIPTDKCDDDAIEILHRTPWAEVKPHVMALLEWLQDMNWPISRPVFEYLKPRVNEFFPELLEILATNDDIWKANVLYLLRYADPVPDDEPLRAAVLRIAQHPTPGEIAEDAAEAATDLAQKWGLIRSRHDRRKQIRGQDHQQHHTLLDVGAPGIEGNTDRKQR